ncbi:hypothetical protein ACEWAO_23940, partial [Vibrio parahaemolyticus]
PSSILFGESPSRWWVFLFTFYLEKNNSIFVSMEQIIQSIEQLFFKWKNIAADRIEKLPQSGSDRTY